MPNRHLEAGKICKIYTLNKVRLIRPEKTAVIGLQII
jgi:hypothetical protein